MNKKVVILISILAFTISVSLLYLLLFMPLLFVNRAVIRVPTDCSEIQKAINLVKTGGTIRVASGRYPETLIINKPLTLVGESQHSTVIEGEGDVITVKSTHVRIYGFTIRNGERGVFLTDDSGSCNISDTIVTKNQDGIYLDSSENNIFSNNLVMNNSYRGIFLMNSHNCVLINNSVTKNGHGVILDLCGNCTLRKNDISRNTCNLEVYETFIHDIDISNTVDEKIIYYLINQSNLIVDPTTFPDAGYLALVNCINVTVKNLVLRNNRYGVQLASTKYSTVENLEVSNNAYGAALFHSESNILKGIIAVGNEYGIKLYNSKECIIQECNMSNNRYGGISLDHSDNCTLENNIITEGDNGIRLDASNNCSIYDNTVTSSEVGVLLSESKNNVISRNVLKRNNWSGIMFLSSDGNIVSENAISNNRYCMDIYYSRNNTIYHNNFIDNQYALFSRYYHSYSNNWDKGYPSGGNYWSDYKGEDVDGDGIGDTPYMINGVDKDRYPLISSNA